MAYTAGNLHLRGGAPGDLFYTYDAAADTLATVVAAGYFNNEDDDLNLTADDLIWIQATDGNCWLRVSSIDSGSAVTTQFAGGNLPLQTYATGTAANLTNLSIGHYEVGTTIATATRAVLPTPYPGAEVIVRRDDTGSQGMSFDAGGSGATGITYDSTGNRRIVLQSEAEGFHVIGVSTTRWRIYGMTMRASVVAPAGGTVFFPGT